MHFLFRGLIVLLVFASLEACSPDAQRPIDRKALVTRHNVKVHQFDTLSSLSVGNGAFAFTVDVTGLQSFPERYAHGIPSGTQSEWGWHSFKDTADYRFEETLKKYEFNGREISFPVQFKEPTRKRDAANWFRENPHRLHLGVVGLEMTKKDGSPVLPKDIDNIDQVLDLWTGTIISKFSIEGIPVVVTTCCHQQMDMISARVESKLIGLGRLKIRVRFPYPTGGHSDDACDWNSPEKHTTTIVKSDEHHAIFQRKLDQTEYYVDLGWQGEATINKRKPHEFELSSQQNDLTISCLFSQNLYEKKLPDYDAVKQNSKSKWNTFWTKGGAIDFSGSTDPRADELERRIVLSQYLLAIQCAGSMPPQETGLTYNSWYGKFHLEMHWWHAAQFALWNRIELLEKSLNWYNDVADKARAIAKRQGYDGLRWMKMTDPSGGESPSGVGSFLIWQQPHFIYFAELCYRAHKDKATLDKYKKLVFETADFMASYAFYDEQNDRYILGKGLIPAQECFDPSETFNPPFELSYWYWGLSTAQRWRERLGLPKNEKWEKVLDKLSALYQHDGLYTPAESTPLAYQEKTHMYDHPAVLGAYGMLPGNRLVDTTIMHRTFDYVWDHWEWDRTWGWDFPLTAMTATRLGMPEKAIDALFMDEKTNTYLANGHNFQNGRLRLYLPGNGGLLMATAMMCAGYDGCDIDNPGIPENGQWKVRWEGLNSMP